MQLKRRLEKLEAIITTRANQHKDVLVIYQNTNESYEEAYKRQVTDSPIRSEDYAMLVCVRYI